MNDHIESIWLQTFTVKSFQPSPIAEQIAPQIWEEQHRQCTYNVTLEARTCKHCCIGKVISIRVRLKPDGTRCRTGGEVKGKLANGVGSHYSHTASEHGVSSITNTDAHTSAASSRLNWRPHRYKWTRPFRRKTKSGFCACAIRFQTHFTYCECV